MANTPHVFASVDRLPREEPGVRPSSLAGYVRAVFRKEVTLYTYGLDKCGRTLADVRFPDGTNDNHELVKDGWCWWYWEYAPGDTVLDRLENEARGGRKGLWADPLPFRRGSGGSGNRVGGHAYFLALARLDSACVASSGTMIFAVKSNTFR